MKSGMFKKFFKSIVTFISMPFKSDADIKAYSVAHPKAGKVARIIKSIFTTINVYVDLYSLNELLKMFGKGIKHFPDITRLVSKFSSKAAKVASVAI